MRRMLKRLITRGFSVRALHHAEAILTHDMPDALREIEEALLTVEIPVTELIRGGGGEGELTQRLRHVLSDTHGWHKHNFVVTRSVDGEAKESSTHEIDHVKRFPGGTVALEIEWNNKDPFYDRDLEAFKRLHADAAISVGVMVTRGESLQSALREVVAEYARRNQIDTLDRLTEYYIPTPRQRANITRAATSLGSFEEGWARAFVSDKFGEATTHWRKLDDRINRGVGNPCPLLLIGIPKDVLVY